MKSSFSCSACGAPLELIKSTICEYCGHETRVEAHLSQYLGSDADKLEYQSICERIKSAEASLDYVKASEYCQRLLELNQNSPGQWLMSLRYLDKLLGSKIGWAKAEEANYFLTGYIRLSESYPAESHTVITSLLKKLDRCYDALVFDKSLSGRVWDSYSNESCRFIMAYCVFRYNAYEVLQQADLLKLVVEELSGNKKEYWLTTINGKVTSSEAGKELGLDVLDFRDSVIKKLQQAELSYSPPTIRFHVKPIPVSQEGSCFVATLVYKNINDPRVVLIRQFRDSLLLTSRLGVLLTRFYYAVSPWLIKKAEKSQIFFLFLESATNTSYYLINQLNQKLWEFSDHQKKS
ncbi:hypothetical protein N9579_05200 [Schleiferiaceae bacterium]|nr:hypothetical protein [Schleiferiaceae bacterium]